MGTPLNNVTGYFNSSVMAHVQNMTGRLMLVHGLIDENVHFRHTARLINALIKHRKRYDLVLFPCERHSPHKAQDRVYMEDIINDFFVNNLGDL
jgi:dipeptidyl-peptidase-4